MSDEFEELSMDLEADDLEDLGYEEEPEQPREVKSKTPATNKKSGNKINLFFQSTIGPSQRQEKLQVVTDAPVGDLKYTVSQIFSLEPEDFHLSYLGRTLDPDDIIANYEVEDGDTLLLIPVSTAGSSYSSYPEIPLS